jgi:hypothetical protein
MGTVCSDYDNDGDTDIFVANDVAENFQNDGTGKSEVGLGCNRYGLHGDEKEKELTAAITTTTDG